MIPRAFITAWRAKAPWSTDAQVEQDLVVCRALVELFSHELLDVPPLLAPGVSFDVARAHERVLEAFISKLPRGSAAKKNRRPR